MKKLLVAALALGFLSANGLLASGGAGASSRLETLASNYRTWQTATMDRGIQFAPPWLIDAVKSNDPNAVEGVSVWLGRRGNSVNAISGSREEGATEETIQTSGSTLLMWAAQSGTPEMVKMLLDRGADISIRSCPPNPPAPDGYSQSVLSFALQNKNLDVLKTLLDHGGPKARQVVNAFSVEQTDMTKSSYLLKDVIWQPIFVHNQGRQNAAAAILLDHGADLNRPVSIDGRLPIFWAVNERNLALIELLLRKGADVNYTDPKRKQSLLIKAATQGNGKSDDQDMKVVNLLLKHGARAPNPIPEEIPRNSEMFDRLTEALREQGPRAGNGGGGAAGAAVQESLYRTRIPSSAAGKAPGGGEATTTRQSGRERIAGTEPESLSHGRIARIEKAISSGGQDQILAHLNNGEYRVLASRESTGRGFSDPTLAAIEAARGQGPTQLQEALSRLRETTLHRTIIE